MPSPRKQKSRSPLNLGFFLVEVIPYYMGPKVFSKYSEVLTDVSRLLFWKDLLCGLPFCTGKVIESQGNGTEKFRES